MRTAKVNIGGVEHPIGYSFRAMFLFEQLAGHGFKVDTLQDEFLFMFCCFMIADADFCGSDFKNFVDALDNDPAAIGRIREVMKTLAAEPGIEGQDADGKKKA